ncbi:MAG: hypothetical protein LUG84_00760 [Akkermansiaceae bacterium]|nr:hypothetical protein [Akkermansiaceae bacterium]
MWSKIIIGTVAVLLFGTFLFYKNNEALVASEFPHAKSLMGKIESVSKDIARDEYTQKYAEMRKRFFDQKLAEFTADDERLKEELATARDEIAKVTKEAQELEETLQSQQAELSAAMKELMSISGMDENEDADMTAILGRIGEIYQSTLLTEQENAQTQAQIDVLLAHSADLNQEIDFEKKRASGRNARQAPATLNASVINTLPNWNYVIINVGTEDDVCVGSRLAVMRGNTKIAELNVTSVEGNRSSADIILSTLVAGESVHIGDRVVSVQAAAN